MEELNKGDYLYTQTYIGEVPINEMYVVTNVCKEYYSASALSGTTKTRVSKKTLREVYPYYYSAGTTQRTFIPIKDAGIAEAIAMRCEESAKLLYSIGHINERIKRINEKLRRIDDELRKIPFINTLCEGEFR